MKTTENYNLYLTDDSSEKFLDWREKMNGLENSNMTKIDEALSSKAEHSISISTSLHADTWVLQDDLYIQKLNIDSLSATQNGYIFVPLTATADQRMAAIESSLSIVLQEDEGLTVGVYGILPTIDIPVCIILFD